MTMNQLLNKPFGEGKEIKFRVVDVVLIIAVLIVGMMIRYQLLDMQGTDYTDCFLPWMNEIRENGGFASLSKEIGNYTPPYMYFITALSYTNLTPLFSYKIVSIFFDLVGAIGMFLLVYEITRNTSHALLAGATLFLLPTVFLNSAAWAQSDMMNVSMILFSLFFLFKKKENTAMIFLGIAFSFKFQAVFIFPFFIIMCLLEKMKWKRFLIVPLVYFILNLPAAIIGRKWSEILTIYFRQTQQPFPLSANFPNLYTALGIEGNVSFMKAGIWFTIALLGCFVYYLFVNKNQWCWNKKTLVLVSCITVSMVLCFLSGMHDRYGLLLDVILIAYATISPKQIWMAATCEFLSLAAYMPYLFWVQPFPLKYAGVLQLLLLGMLVRELFLQKKKI